MAPFIQDTKMYQWVIHEEAFKDLVKCIAKGRFDEKDVYFQLRTSPPPPPTFIEEIKNVIARKNIFAWSTLDWRVSFEKKSGVPYPETFVKNEKWIGKREFLSQLKNDLAEDGYSTDGKVELDFRKKVSNLQVTK